MLGHELAYFMTLPRSLALDKKRTRPPIRDATVITASLAMLTIGLSNSAERLRID